MSLSDLSDNEHDHDPLCTSEMLDPDYESCFETGIPLSVFRLIYALQYSEIKQRINHPDDTCTISFELPDIFMDDLMATLIWESGNADITKAKNMITIRISKTSWILEGLDHVNPMLPIEIWKYLDVRSKKESVNVSF